MPSVSTCFLKEEERWRRGSYNASAGVNLGSFFYGAFCRELEKKDSAVVLSHAEVEKWNRENQIRDGARKPIKLFLFLWWKRHVISDMSQTLFSSLFST